jgi:hypothetical protein
MNKSNIKRYRVKHTWNDYEVTLEVDLDRLTPERASLLNGFWSDHKNRVSEENGNVVRSVIRLFGSTMINMMLREGGSSFSANPKHWFDDAGPIWSKDLHDEEGWGGTEEGDNFGWCGIRVIAADVESTGFDDVELEELAHAN